MAIKLFCNIFTLSNEKLVSLILANFWIPIQSLHFRRELNNAEQLKAQHAMSKPSLAPNLQTIEKIFVRCKRTSLLCQSVNYGRKKFCKSGFQTTFAKGLILLRNEVTNTSILPLWVSKFYITSTHRHLILMRGNQLPVYASR